MKTYKQVVEYLGEAQYHYHMGGGSRPTLEFDADLIEFIYGKAPTAPELVAVEHELLEAAYPKYAASKAK
jgi:hypothetical protein